MAQLWFADREGAWTALPLEEVPYVLAEWPPRPLDTRADSGTSARAVRMVPGRGPHGMSWAVMAATPGMLSVCGQPVALGMRALADRDSIRIDGMGTLFFSTETLARVEPFPRQDRECFCPRDKLPLESGTPAVRCPGCGLWYHERPDRPCWTYAPTCQMCPQPTAWGSGFRWTPEQS